MIHAQNTKVLNLTPPAAIVDDASLTVTEIDTKTWDYCQIFLVMGATDIAMTALAVTESDVTASGHANVTGLVWGTSANHLGVTSTLPSATNDNGVFIFDINLNGRKRFLDLTATVGDGTSGGYYTVMAILSRGENVANTATARGAVEILRV